MTLTTDPLGLLRHDMIPRDPYPHAAKTNATNDFYFPRAPTTLITQLPRAKSGYQPNLPDPTAADRARIRYENTRGALGGNLNFDGSNRSEPMISMNQAELSEKTRQKNLSESDGCIYFGSGQREAEREHRENFKHRPGINASIYTDSHATKERKRLIQLEMAKYEKMQTEERDRKRREEREQRAKEQQNVKWPFGTSGANQVNFNHITPFRPEELALRQYEKERADQYARELDRQIEDNRKYQEYVKKTAPSRDDDQKWMFHHSHMPGKRARVPLEPPRDPTTDLISGIPKTYNPNTEIPKRRNRPDDERKDVFPFNHDQYSKTHPPLPDKPLPAVEPTSLPFGNRDRKRVTFESSENGVMPAYQEPQFGRRKFTLDNPINEEDQKIAELEAKQLRLSQERDLRERTEMERQRREEEHTLGKKFGQNYPWNWGHDAEIRSEHPHHRVTDLGLQPEPIDKNKAQKYQADLDALVKQKYDIQMRERQLDTDLWRNHNQNTFENMLGRPHQATRHRRMLG